MTATEELRRLLNELGVEYEVETDEDGWAFTRWHGFDDTGWLAASDELCGLLDLCGRYLFTHGQAIAATLGRGTCHPEQQYLDTHSDLTVTVCSECGVPTDDLDDCNYCPNCGAKVVEE